MPLAQKVVGTGAGGALLVNGTGGGGAVPVTDGGTPLLTAGSYPLITVLPSAVRNAATSSGFFSNTGYQGLLLLLSCTVAPGVSSIRLDLRGEIAGASTVWHTAFAATVTTGNFLYVLHPGQTVADYGAGITATRNITVPTHWFAQVVHIGAGNFTYSVYAYPIP